MNKKFQIMAFKLSVLSTFMLCTTANNYASDIEIYKAPTLADGNAKIMFVLDVSTYMYQSADNSGGAGGGNSGIESASPIEADFGITCSHSSVQSETRHAGTEYEYTASYCETPVAGASLAVQQGCFIFPTDSTKYRCYDRLSSLKQALFEVIDDPTYSAEAAVADTTGRTPKISLGFSFYPTVDAFGSPLQPQLLNAAGRLALKKRISDLKPGEQVARGQGLPFPQTNQGGKDAQVAHAYGRGVQSLIAAANAGTSSERQCSGYGVYMVSGRNPEADVLAGTTGAYGLLTNSLNTQTQATDPLNAACNLTTNDSSDGRSWKCVEKAAELLMAGKSSLNMPIRTAVVSMGKGVALGRSFAFYDVDPRTDFDRYETTTVDGVKISTTLPEIEERYQELLSATPNNYQPLLNDRRYAIRTGVVGDGGYYSVSNIQDLKGSIKDFIAKTLEVEIPYITTGAPTIPQDPLNPALVQSDAYYAQFKPTPKVVDSTGSRLWVGNMKKYHINNLGRLVGKNNSVIGVAEEQPDVVDSLGRLINGTHDFWAPDVNSDLDLTIAKGDENTWGSELYARMGGMKSQLPLGTSIVSGATVENRKLLTNRVITNGVASEGTSLTQIERVNYATGGSAASDPKKTDITTLLDLRQVGAVMHSSPLLLSNKGKMDYDEETGTYSTTDREDYILFGTTQGLLHVVKADDYTSTNGGGKEVFAFVPHEMIENQSKAFLDAEVTLGGTANLFYGIDAPWTAYTEYVPGANGVLTVSTGKVVTVDEGEATLKGKQFVYGGLRMGGRSYYALDLKDMSNPALAFHINPQDQKIYHNNSSQTFSELQYMGQSWSKPKVAWVNWGGERKLVMFVGGGYDMGYESGDYNQTNGKGAGVYMFDALNGDLLWWASSNATTTSASNTNSGVIALKDDNLQYSVVSEIKTIDRNNDSLVDHLYFGDLGGQVFRIDLDNQAATIGGFAKRSTRILNLNQNGPSPRFYSAPAFSIYRNNANGYLFAAISIGSGNLSRPLVEYTSGREFDALYTIYDKDVTRADLYTISSSDLDTRDVSVGNATTVLALNEITTNTRFADDTIIAPYASSAGWYFKFKGENNIAQQEKVFYTPTVIANDLYVSTYDSSKVGLSGECGGGVWGESRVRLFCMPFGQCAASRGYTSESDASDLQGYGIQNHTIGSNGDGTTRLISGAKAGDNLTHRYPSPVKLILQRWYER